MRTLLAVCLFASLSACNSNSEDAGAGVPGPVAGTPTPPAPTPPPPPPDGAVKDPGPRSGPPAAGEPLAGLSREQLAAFEEGKAALVKEFDVKAGLGPAMNLDSCSGCHGHPAPGGSSLPINPQVAFAAKLSATNVLPPFISVNGPGRFARFVKNPDGTLDGRARAAFTIAGRTDAPADCNLAQPDFAKEFNANNVATRIALPMYGDGLLEQVPNQVLSQNLASNAQEKAALGIRGKNPGTGRLGWKAQANALATITPAAFNAELGVTSDFFPLEPGDSLACQGAPVPNTTANFGAGTVGQGLADNEKVAAFARFLAPPARSADTPGGKPSIDRGRQVFKDVGCALCHTPQLRTGNASIAVLANKDFNPYTDMLVHDMGTGLADGIPQGVANGQEWRTTPLWGLGQRLFLLHDGRTADVREAILAHKSPGSEASAVVDRFSLLPSSDAQDLLNFLRSL